MSTPTRERNCNDELLEEYEKLLVEAAAHTLSVKQEARKKELRGGILKLLDRADEFDDYLEDQRFE